MAVHSIKKEKFLTESAEQIESAVPNLEELVLKPSEVELALHGKMSWA